MTYLVTSLLTWKVLVQQLLKHLQDKERIRKSADRQELLYCAKWCWRLLPKFKLPYKFLILKIRVGSSLSMKGLSHDAHTIEPPLQDKSLKKESTGPKWIDRKKKRTIIIAVQFSFHTAIMKKLIIKKKTKKGNGLPFIIFAFCPLPTCEVLHCSNRYDANSKCCIVLRQAS